MLFQDYSLLLVSASKPFNEMILPLFRPGRDDPDPAPVTVVNGINAARRTLAARPYDLIVIHAPLPDGLGTRLAADACLNSEAGVMLLVDRELYEDICDKALSSGVIVAARPVNPRTLEERLHILCAVRERLRRAERKRVSVEEKIEEIRLVNRAKWLLIERTGMREAEAHRYIEKQAMNQRVSRRKIAEIVLQTYK